MQRVRCHSLENVSLELIDMTLICRKWLSVHYLLRPDRERMDVSFSGRLEEVEALKSGPVDARTVVDQIAKSDCLEPEGLGAADEGSRALGWGRRDGGSP